MNGRSSTPPNSELASFPVTVRFQKTLLLALLFSASLVILGQGIGQHTGITAKDEYHLTFRTALSMVEDDVWIVPHLQGVPRLSKPPMLYWLTRASFEVLGISLTSARIVNTFFSALLIIALALIGFECTQNYRFGLSAALIALSTVGMAIQSKFLMLEIPTTALSSLAFYLLLKWEKTANDWLLAGVALFLSMGFLTKGPAVFVVFGSGFLAFLVTSQGFRSLVLDRKWRLVGSLFLFLACTIPWFFYVYLEYPDQGVQILQRVISGRNIGDFSLLPITSPAILSLPWSFLLINLMIRFRTLSFKSTEIGNAKLMFLVWLGLSILPFFFIKTFERYLIGSLVPISLLCAMTIEPLNRHHLHSPARVGTVLTVILTLGATGAIWWFNTSFAKVVVALVAIAIYTFVWWEGTHLIRMALSAALLWMVIFGFLYPTLGINAIPPRILEEVQGRQVILYGDQQPSLLPIQIGRSLRVTPRLTHNDLFTAMDGNPLVFANESDTASLEQNLEELGVDFERVDSYKTLSSRVSWIRFARKGAGVDNWIQAVQTRSLDPIKMTIVLYELKPHAGSAP